MITALFFARRSRSIATGNYSAACGSGTQALLNARARTGNHQPRTEMHSQKMNAPGTLAAGYRARFQQHPLHHQRPAQIIIEDNVSNPEKSTRCVDRIKTAVEQGAGYRQGAMLGFSAGTSDNRPSAT